MSSKTKSKYDHRTKKERTCVVCGGSFMSKAGNAKYCSDDCSDKVPASNGYRQGTDSKKDWKRMKRKVDRNVCYRCGWSRTTCDLAHIEARKDGGSNDPKNLTVLCPNCHRLADDTNQFDIENMPTVYEKEDQWG